MYINEVIVTPIMTQTRLSKPKKIKFRSNLGFNQVNLVLKKEQSVVIPLLKEFSAEKINLQYKMLENERVRTDIFQYKFVLEIDKKGHIDRYQNEKNERQTKIEKKQPYCKFFHRNNPDVEGFDIFLEISKIQKHITQPNEEILKANLQKNY